ncbi:uncharacterized protein LOC144531008 [Sander vitreus]
MQVQELLLETLDTLRKEDFKTLQWYLSMEVLAGCKPIPESHLEDASRTATIRKMIESYNEELAVKVTVEILKKMKNNYAAEKLENKYAGGKTAAPSASSSAVAPAAPATLTAQQGSVIIAPQFNSSTAGTMNITFNKSEMQVPLLILDTLDELGADDFKKFQWHLTQPVLDGCQPIRKGHLENADRQDTVSKMIDSYGEETAVKVTVEILKRMNHNNAAEKLNKTGGSTAGQPPPPTPPSSSSSSSSSSGLTSTAGATVCAQGKSVIVAPNITGTSSGVSINMNINN